MRWLEWNVIRRIQQLQQTRSTTSQKKVFWKIQRIIIFEKKKLIIKDVYGSKQYHHKIDKRAGNLQK